MLISISLFLLLVRIVYPYFLEESFVDIRYLPPLPEESSAFTDKQDSSKSEPFVFDPNSVNLGQLLRLGFSEKSANALIRFRNKGFVFRQKSDLKKVFGVSENLYQRLEAYILITPKKQPSARNEQTPAWKEEKQEPSPATHIELNAADSTVLLTAKGIGPVYARRILKYRALLGGFQQVEQLKEVYGFNEELFQKVKDQFYTDPGLVKRLHINTDDFKTINKHPYLSYEATGAIFNLRRKKKLQSEDLKALLNDEVLFQKLLPYLQFD